MFLAVVLLIVALPRFNVRDSGPFKRYTASATATPYGLPLDVEGYRRLSEYFRGQTPADSLIPPFCFRPLVPLTASLLPVDSHTAINLINLASLFGVVVVLDRLMRHLGFGSRARVVGSLLFIVSFPTFYYGTLGFVDPPSLLIVTSAAYLALQGKYLSFLGLVPLAVLVKETNAVIAFLPAIHAWATGELSSANLRLTVSSLVLALMTAIAIHAILPFPNPGFIWWPRMEAVLKNTSRPRAQLSFLLTLGLPGALAVAALVGGRAKDVLRRSDIRFLLGGAGLALALYAYSLTAAYADGRVVWIIYPFIIPLAAVWFERVTQRAIKGLNPRGTVPHSS